MKALQIFGRLGHVPHLGPFVFRINIPVHSSNVLLSFEQALIYGEAEALSTTWYSILEALFLWWPLFFSVTDIRWDRIQI